MKESSDGRILVVAKEFCLGGAAYLTLRYIRKLSDRYDIDLLVSGPCDNGMLAQLPSQVSVFRMEADSLEMGGDPLDCLELVLLHRGMPPFHRSYRAVLATSIFPDWAASIAVSLVRSPRKWVFLVDEALNGYAEWLPARRSAVECCLLAADWVFPVSRALWKKMALQCPMLARRPWEVLRPPVEIEREILDLPENVPDWGKRDRPVVVTVARLVSRKGIMESLQAHHRLKQQGLVFRWYVVGSGPEEQRLREEIIRLDMQEDFRIVGNQENAHAWMRHSDIFALFSSSEGCPTVVMEALAMECAVIMTEVNGADEVIDNGSNGLIVSNTEESIEEGLSRLLRDAGLRETFRKNLVRQPFRSDPEELSERLVEKIEEAVPAPEPVKVSILIPAYNHEDSLNRAVASALMQDFPSLEVVVCDDASTDRSEETVRPWLSDPRFRYVRNEKNLGRVANYRRALTGHARGEWVLMLDGDDYLVDPGFIRLAREAQQRHADQNVVFVQAGHRTHYANGERADADILPRVEGPECLMDGADYLRFVYDTGFFTHLGTLYPRRLAIDNGFYTADISSSDMDSLLRLALEGRVLVLKTIAGCWVQHGRNASANLPLEDIAANVRIFRQIAHIAAEKKLAEMPQLEPALTRYEAGTLAYLFGRTVGKTARNPGDVWKMLRVVISVNPKLLLNRRLLKSCRRHFRDLAGLTWRRWWSSNKIPEPGRKGSE